MIFRIIVCFIFLVFSNITDLRGYKIKNKAVLATIVVGLVYAAFTKSFLDSVYGMLIPLVLFPLYALRMLGAGDVKALCAVGAVLGFKLSVMTMLLSIVSGGVMALGFMLFNKNFIARFKNLFSYLKLCFVTRKIQKYDFGGGQKSYFRFSFAVTAGTLLAIVNHYMGIL